MSRGRLIFPKRVVIARYDPAATEDAGGFDRSLRELLVSNHNAAGQPRVTPRREVPVDLRAQIETDTFQRLQMGVLGNAGASRLVCVFFAPELEDKGFLDEETRAPLLKPTDRLAAILELNGKLIHKIEDPPGLYAVEVKPCGFGFGSGGYNLVEVSFEARPRGTSGGVGGL